MRPSYACSHDFQLTADGKVAEAYTRQAREMLVRIGQ